MRRDYPQRLALSAGDEYLAFLFVRYFLVDCYNLPGYNRSIQVLDVGSAGCWFCMSKRLFERGCQRFGIAGTYRAAAGATNDLRDIPYIRGDDRYIAGHGFFDNVG